MHQELVGHPRLYQKCVGHHTTYGELYYYVTNISISCGRCIAVKVGQMPIHSVQEPIHASGIGRTSTLVSEMYWTSTLRMGNYTTMLSIY